MAGTFCRRISKGNLGQTRLNQLSEVCWLSPGPTRGMQATAYSMRCAPASRCA